MTNAASSTDETIDELTERLDSYRNDSRVMLQAMREGHAEKEFRSPNPLVGYINVLTKQEVETCLADAILKRIAWSLPLAATQNIWNLSLGDDYSSTKSSKIIRDYKGYHDKLKTRARLRKALCLSRSHGGSVIIIKIDDGQHYSRPVNIKNIKSIKGLIVRHRWQIAPAIRYNINLFDIDDIEHYEILDVNDDVFYKNLTDDMSSKTQFSFDDKFIHSSRILRFDGVLMPDDWMIDYNNGWGLSIFSQVWKYYKYYSNDLNAVNELIKTHSVLEHSFEGLRELIKSSSEESIAAIKQTMKAIRMMYDLYGMVLHDSKEQFNWNARPVTGIDSLVELHKNAVTAASEMPHTIIWGESPGGLGRDGKETQINWSNHISDYQGENIEPRLGVLDNYINLAKDGPTKGKPLEDYKRYYGSILKHSIEDVREGRNKDVQTLASGIQAGFLTQDEARTVPANSDWWPELNLDEKAWNKIKEDEKKKADYMNTLEMGNTEEATTESTEAVDETIEPEPELEEDIKEDSQYNNDKSQLVNIILSMI